MFSYGLKVCGNNPETEDAIHDMFVDVWKYRAGLSDTTSISFYLFRALRRKLYKNQKASDKVLHLDLSVNTHAEEIEPSAEVKTVTKESGEINKTKLKAGIDQLPDRQREAIYLRYYGELSFDEISQMLDINPQSVRNLITRGLTQLRKLVIISLGGFFMCYWLSSFF